MSSIVTSEIYDVKQIRSDHSREFENAQFAEFYDLAEWGWKEKQDTSGNGTSHASCQTFAISFLG